MKKIFNLLLVFIMIFSLNVTTVFAEGEKNQEPKEEESEKKDDKEEEKELDKEEKNGDEKEVDKESDKDDLKSDTTLEYLKINDTKVVPSGTTYKYDIRDENFDDLKITYQPKNSKATVKLKDGAIENSKDEEKKTFYITVTSEDKVKTTTYDIVVTKKIMDTDSSLKKLTVNGTEIELDKESLKYKTSVSYGTKKLEIEAIPTSEKAKIADFKNNKVTLDFFENSKDIKIVVTAEDESKSTYTLTVTKRAESDVTLKSLKIKNQDIEFDSEVTEYELKVLKNVSKLEIEAKATDKNANVKITNPNLVIGENEVKIEVTNDGNTNTYLIKVIKLDEDDETLAHLKSLEIENYELDFKADKYEYDLKIENENYLVIKALAKMKDAKVDITGNLDLEDGSIIKIKVKYDEDVYNVYKINIIKDGTVSVSKHTSRKAIAVVILFDIISGIVMAIIEIKDYNDKKKNNRNKKNDSKLMDIDLKKKNNSVIDGLDNDIDVI